MVMDIKSLIKNNITPFILALVCLFGLALPLSDQANISMLFFMVIIFYTMIVWLGKDNGYPGINKRNEFNVLLVLTLLLLLAVFVRPLMDYYNGQIGQKGHTLDFSSFVLEAVKLVAILACFTLGFKISTTNQGARKNLDAMVIIISIWALIAIMMFVKDPGGLYGQTRVVQGRLAAAFSSANSAGALFGSMATFCFIRLFNRFISTQGYSLSNRVSILNLFGFVLCISALFLSQSRGAWLSTIGSIIIFSIISFAGNLKQRFAPFIIFIVLLVLVPVISGFADNLLGRFDTYGVDFATRSHIFSEHLKFAMQNEVFGSGLGSFHQINNLILNEKNYADLSGINALHNNYIQWFEETGIVGLIPLALLNIFIIGFIFFRFINKKNTESRLIAALGFYFVFLFHTISDFAAQEPVIASINAIILGIAFAMAGNVSVRSYKVESKEENKLIIET